MQIQIKREVKKRIKPFSGFVPSVLSPHKIPKALFPMECKHFENVQKARLFLISNRSFLSSCKKIPTSPNKYKVKDKTENSKNKKTKNRKYVSYSDIFFHNGTSYKVNASKSGIFTPIMRKLLEQLEACQKLWKRVFILRFDLHLKTQTKNNEAVSRFRKNLSKRILREYDIKRIGYLWVREQERSKAQHYHVVLFLDGNKIKHSSKLLQTIRDDWKKTAKGHVPTIKNPFYFIDNQATKSEAIYRISYLAKSRGKGYRENQVKDYSASRFK